MLDAVLESVSAAGLLKAGGRQRSDATHVLAAVREVNRLESVVETLRAALNALAAAAPQAVWRKPKDCPPGQLRIRSVYDPDARNGAKRDRAWCGYKVHLTETCEPDAPHLITQVITTTAATASSTTGAARQAP